ncbi:hypothetical protein M885DRAFT_568296 [Pelagophyceae sp. CCMP2097]|nr:hypothetical protein M885DRAFT_568296 [Pelagophyceae sp. CCMP2097]
MATPPAGEAPWATALDVFTAHCGETAALVAVDRGVDGALVERQLLYKDIVHFASTFTPPDLPLDARVAVALPSTCGFAVLLIALWPHCTVAPLSPTLTPTECAFALADLPAAAAVVVGGGGVARSEAEKLGIPVLTLTESDASKPGFFRLDASTPLPFLAGRRGPARRGDVALVLFTSGTT